jgi:hypothetical protein
MKFAKIVFLVAGIWGVLLLAPLYFLFDMIGVQDPPPITHPAFFYGFAGLGLAWQVAFFIIWRDPQRFRPMMIPSILEKIGYGAAVVVLYAQGRMHPQDLAFGCVDLLFAALFAVAFLRLKRDMR